MASCFPSEKRDFFSPSNFCLFLRVCFSSDSNIIFISHWTSTWIKCLFSNFHQTFAVESSGYGEFSPYECRSGIFFRPAAAYTLFYFFDNVLYYGAFSKHILVHALFLFNLSGFGVLFFSLASFTDWFSTGCKQCLTLFLGLQEPPRDTNCSLD